MKIHLSLLAASAFLICMRNTTHAAAAPENFIYTSSGDLEGAKNLVSRPDIGGVQIVYNWRQLETAQGQYDFSAIEADLAIITALNKKLFIQIQDRFFEPKARNVPDYLLADRAYGGGITAQFDNPGESKPVGSGWVAQQWNPAVRQRYQALLAALAARFDGEVYGVNLPETAIDLDPKHEPDGYSCDAYFRAEMENLAFARKAFNKSKVVQYVNFWPCEWENDHNYMGRLFEFAAKNGVGLGGPDIVPYRKGQMKNSYPFFNKYKGKLAFVGLAVQEPTLTYRNPKTKKPFTKEEFTAFADDYLGADVIFWSTSTPWLRR
ncbi:hypothetical protein [Rhizobium grahamii]|uniref:Glycoside hydrolase family 42 N-terminal domain-containing protein n=1 Tax=Rhizobium grahamii TaxID=1120045 RepID=A0A370KQ33_9HYPH|nr:hypothetical protein [Rhizobium grahamii]RDJ11453.1 hypothetical protein B5K06_14340 [Rhizobium grahamii]